MLTEIIKQFCVDCVLHEQSSHHIHSHLEFVEIEKHTLVYKNLVMDVDTEVKQVYDTNNVIIFVKNDNDKKKLISVGISSQRIFIIPLGNYDLSSMRKLPEYSYLSYKIVAENLILIFYKSSEYEGVMYNVENVKRLFFNYARNIKFLMLN